MLIPQAGALYMYMYSNPVRQSLGCVNFQKCRSIIRRAYAACTAGISKAQAECNKTTADLGALYMQTQWFLRNSHLERYAPDHVKEQHLQRKRQIPLGGTETPYVTNRARDQRPML